MPDRIELNGRWYVAEDALPQPSTTEADRWEPLKRLCTEYGADPHAAYRAVKAGALDARMPNGQVRGYRCRRGEFVRWYEEVWLAR